MAPEPPPHFKFSLDTKQHCDPSDGEPRSTQITWNFETDPSDQTCSVPRLQCSCDVGFLGIHTESSALGSFNTGDPAAL